MKPGRNMLAGLASSIWAALIGLAVVPFYLKYLGVEAYGLIGFLVMLQALLQLLDLGMAATMNREVARYQALGELSGVGSLLHTLAVVYWAVALLIAVMIAVLAPWLAAHWLQAQGLPPETVSHAIMLMGVVIACRWPIGLYQGVIVGAQRLVISSAIVILMTTVSSVGGVIALAFIAPDIHLLFAWQAGAGLICALAMRAAAWRILGKTAHRAFAPAQIKHIWRFAAGMSGITLTALAFTQLDKLILSKMVGLEAFGYYMLATTIAGALYLLIAPLFNVIFPKFSEFVATGDTAKLVATYRLWTRLFVTVLFPITVMLMLFAQDFVFVWTGNASVATNVAPLVALLVVGTALNGVMNFPYALQLAYGMTWMPLTINVILMCFMAPMLVYLIQKYGALGGAMTWTIIEAVYVLFGTWLTHRYILKGIASRWLVWDVGLPLALAIFVSVPGYHLLQIGLFSHIERVIGAVFLMLITATVLLLTSRQLRDASLDSIRYREFRKMLDW